MEYLNLLLKSVSTRNEAIILKQKPGINNLWFYADFSYCFNLWHSTQLSDDLCEEINPYMSANDKNKYVKRQTLLDDVKKVPSKIIDTVIDFVPFPKLVKDEVIPLPKPRDAKGSVIEIDSFQDKGRNIIDNKGKLVDLPPR